MMASVDKIHILHILPTLSAGGMELALCRVINGLSSDRFRHSIVCLKGNSEINEYLNKEIDTFYMHAKPNEPGLPFRLFQVIRNIKPDLIHARNWSAWPDVAFARLFYKPSIPVIFSFHGFDSVGQIPFRRRLISKITSKITDHIFTVADVSRNVMVENLGLKASEISIVPNGIDTDRFAPACSIKNNKAKTIIGTVGSLTPVKNHILLIQACSDLISLGFKIELIIAGTGPEKDRILNVISELGIQQHIRLLGYVKNVDSFLKEIDIFALSSSSEAHPNALLEAMASGLPCIAPDVGGISQVFDGGRAGLLYQVGNKKEMVNCFRKLIKDIFLRKEIARIARKRACDSYSLENMLAEYESMYFNFVQH